MNTPRPSRNFTGVGGVCPPGAYCPEGTSDPIGCPSGTFSNVTLLESASNCTLCSDGHYCEETNLTEPTGEIAVFCVCIEWQVHSMSSSLKDSDEPKVFNNTHFLLM